MPQCLHCGKCDGLSIKRILNECTIRSVNYKASGLTSINNASIRTCNSASVQLNEIMKIKHTA